MAAPQPPDLQVFGNAVNGMTTTMQAYTQHHQTMSQQLQLIGSQPHGAVIQNLADSVQALTAQMQAHAAHQAAQWQAQAAQMQALTTQVQGLATQMQSGFAQVNARINNIDVKFQNSRRSEATDNLEVPCSLDTGANAQAPVGTPIANFPPTALALMAMNIHECRRILTALAIPFQNNNTVTILRLKIRKAIGLPAL